MNKFLSISIMFFARGRSRSFLRHVRATVILGIALTHFPQAAMAANTLITYEGTTLPSYWKNGVSIADYYADLPGSPTHSNEWTLLSTPPSHFVHSLPTYAFADSLSASITWNTDVKNIGFWYGNSLGDVLGYPGLSVQGYNNGSLAFNSGVLENTWWTGSSKQYLAPPDAAIDRLVFTSSIDAWSMDDLSYSVTPEPLATTLFLIGGAPIAANLYRKKKRALKV